MVAKQDPSCFKVVQRVIGTELVALSALVVVLGIYHPQAAVSAFWGGMIFLVPNAYFTYYAFRYRGAEKAYTVAVSLLRGQKGKTVLNVVGFALAFRFVQPLHTGYLFAAYVFVLVVHIFVAARISERFGDSKLKSSDDTKE